MTESADKTTQKASDEIKTFMGETLATPIPYTYEYDVYANLAAAKASEDWPSDNEVLKWVNTTLKNNAKSAAYNKALTDKRDEYEKSEPGQLAALRKNAIALGFEGDEAEIIAQNALAKAKEKAAKK